jgi:hypothetical protein
VYTVTVNVLCRWFRIFKEKSGRVLLSGVQFIQCFEYGVTYIDVLCIVCIYVAFANFMNLVFYLCV